jgi:hypothetical protein
MPNWVTNTLTIECADRDVLLAVGARLRAPIPGRDGDIHIVTDTKFSFWNIIAPTNLDSYFGVCDSAGMQDRDNWYNWNNRNWGSKWDARTHFAEMVDGKLVYEFDTPWAPPIQVIETLAENHPELEITLRYVEEQGWGGEHWFQDQISNETESWDIPETHEESVYAFGECWHCQDIGNLYQDCPEAQASQSHEKDIELMGECRWCEINEDGRYDDCPEDERAPKP